MVILCDGSDFDPAIKQPNHLDRPLTIKTIINSYIFLLLDVFTIKLPEYYQLKNLS